VQGLDAHEHVVDRELTSAESDPPVDSLDPW
jgi:hypothetical protein